MPQRVPRRDPSDTWSALTVIAGVSITVAHLLNHFTFRVKALNVNAEYTPAAALAACAIGACAIGVALLTRGGVVPRLSGGTLTCLLGFFAVDEFAAIHERVGVRVARSIGLSEAWDSIVWPIVYLPLAVTIAFLLLECTRGAPARVARVIRRSLILLCIAVAFEVVSAPQSTALTASGVIHVLEGGLEEALELVAWGWMAIALLSWATSPESSDHVNAPQPSGLDSTAG